MKESNFQGYTEAFKRHVVQEVESGRITQCHAAPSRYGRVTSHMFRLHKDLCMYRWLRTSIQKNHGVPCSSDLGCKRAA